MFAPMPFVRHWLRVVAEIHRKHRYVHNTHTHTHIQTPGASLSSAATVDKKEKKKENTEIFHQIQTGRDFISVHPHFSFLSWILFLLFISSHMLPCLRLQVAFSSLLAPRCAHPVTLFCASNPISACRPVHRRSCLKKSLRHLELRRSKSFARTGSCVIHLVYRRLRAKIALCCCFFLLLSLFTIHRLSRVDSLTGCGWQNLQTLPELSDQPFSFSSFYFFFFYKSQLRAANKQTIPFVKHWKSFEV